MLRVFARGARRGLACSAPAEVAFRFARWRRRPRLRISRLNGWPSLSPVNASLAPSRAPPHDSVPGWFAIPFLCRTFINNSLTSLVALNVQTSRLAGH
jgi:hypothetical protein